MMFRVLHQPSTNQARCPYRVIVRETGREIDWINQYLDYENPSEPSQQRPLSDEAEFAEDLAIRYADSRRGPRSGHFEGMAEYVRTRDQCMITLFKVIGSSHGVTDEQVRRSVGHRQTSIDLAV